MKLLIFSESLAENPHVMALNVNEPCIWIAITSPGNPAIKPASDHVLSTLNLWFDDASLDRPWPLQQAQHMTDDQANQIVEFVNRWKDGVGLICVNCQAGICRSSAVAVELSLWLNKHDSGILDNYLYHPNRHVRRMVRMAVDRQQQPPQEDVLSECR